MAVTFAANQATVGGGEVMLLRTVKAALSAGYDVSVVGSAASDGVVDQAAALGATPAALKLPAALSMPAPCALGMHAIERACCGATDCSLRWPRLAAHIGLCMCISTRRASCSLQHSAWRATAGMSW
ncbi:hypothetical protein [Ornithinimicrobium sp. INDO-MA30-4]|uniref:hypothetical protein n=1 Tax=Ornithinimicrobium sp. INDO-MA30-4 TaxID=2908651 RepID=UPI001F43A555|nr:hypothetical protein [Ornithinimicrobium sp. INDO-MA30-4]UJH69883.1 hypothetical protein L0A91_11640 [Ornithinimicrobium sp. INDO-MA30-4]